MPDVLAAPAGVPLPLRARYVRSLKARRRPERDLRDRVGAWRIRARIEHIEGRPVDIKRVEALAAGCLALLDDRAPNLREVQAAIHCIADDARAEAPPIWRQRQPAERAAPTNAGACLGAEVQVFNAVARRVGRPDLLIR